MALITTIFSDVGGVLLTNGWDHIGRQDAAEKFDLDFTDFEAKHQKVAADLDSGLIGVRDYLNQTVFDRPRSFMADEFIDFMKSLSEPISGRLELMSELKATKKYLLATLSNESYELEIHRNETFKMGSIFDLLFCSCFMRCRKPHDEIYMNALNIANRTAEECVFIDDRVENLVAPKKLGMQTILCKTTGQVRMDLANLGVQFK